MPPVQPMLAKSVKGIPDPSKFDDGLSFEPKWDGFRCIVFKDGDEVEMTSRNTKPLTRYFPEVAAAIREQLPERCVLDGELFVAVGSRLEFEVLQERIHPAESRITMLAEKTPASFVAFDVLAFGDDSLVEQPFSVRRSLMERELDGTGRSDVPHPHDDRRGGGGGVVRGVRGRRARRGGRQADGGAVPAERAHDAQDQARAHSRRGAGRLPPAQDLDPGQAPARLAPAGSLRRREAAAHRGVGLLHGSPARGADRGAQAPRVRDRGPPVGRVGGMGDRQPGPGARARRAGGARARTCRSRRCVPSASSR